MSGYQLISNYLGGIIKKYLFGLGAMIVGAGLMFVLMHGEVNAEDMKKIKCESFETGEGDFALCKIKDLTCVFVHAPTLTSSFQGTSCVKS